METVTKKKRKRPGPSIYIRSLEPGESVTFSTTDNSYSSIRSIACTTGKMFGTYFRVRSNDDTITVTRTNVDYFPKKR